MLKFEAVAKISETQCFGIAIDHNGLYEINIKTGACSFVGFIPDEHLFGKRLYVSACFINNKIYFVPYTAKQIAVYDISANTIYKIPIKECKKEKYNPNNKFSGCSLYKNYVYITPCTYPAVIIIDITDDSISYYNDWVTNESFLFRKWLTPVKNKIYVPSATNNLVLCFDMDTRVGKLYHVGNHNFGSWSMLYDDGNFWLFPVKEPCIIKWNPNTNSCIEYDNFPTTFQGNDFCFTRGYKYNGSIYTIPAYANMSLSLNPCTGQITNSELNWLTSNEKTEFLFQIDQFIFLSISDCTSSRIVSLNTETNAFSPITFTSQNQCDYQLKLLSFNNTIPENDRFTLNNFLWAVQNRN